MAVDGSLVVVVSSCPIIITVSPDLVLPVYSTLEFKILTTFCKDRVGFVGLLGRQCRGARARSRNSLKACDSCSTQSMRRDRTCT